jgi:hypothetical protein
MSDTVPGLGAKIFHARIRGMIDTKTVMRTTATSPGICDNQPLRATNVSQNSRYEKQHTFLSGC